jgi:hypothetical protein
VRYLEEKYPESLTADENNKIRLPLPFETIKCFFGWLSTNTDLPKKKKIDEGVFSDDEDGEGDDDDSDDEDDAIDHIAGEGEVQSPTGRGRRGDPGNEPNTQEASSMGPTMDMFNDNEKTISSSCMGGYKSALKTYCEDHKTPLDGDTERWLNTFVRGYKKKVLF